MVYTEQERRIRHRIAQKKYLERNKEKAKNGDKKAKQILLRTKKSQNFSSCKSFIMLHATKEDLNILRDCIAKRAQILSKKEKNNLEKK